MTTVEMRVRVPHCGPAGGGRPWLVLIAVLALGTGGVSNDRQVYSIFQYFLSSNQSCIADQIRYVGELEQKKLQVKFMPELELEL